MAAFCGAVMSLPTVWRRSRAACLASLLLSGIASAGQPENAPPGSYARAHYDIFLVETCGLLTAEVQAQIDAFDPAGEARVVAALFS